MKNYNEGFRSTFENGKSSYLLPSNQPLKNGQCEELSNIHKKCSSEAMNGDYQKQNISFKNKNNSKAQSFNFIKKDYISNSTHNLLLPQFKTVKSTNPTSTSTPIKYPVNPKEKTHFEKKKILDNCFRSVIIRNPTENNQFTSVSLMEGVHHQRALKEKEKGCGKEDGKVSKGRRTLPYKNKITTPTFLKKIIQKNKKPREFKISDFYIVKKLGIGKYGTVSLAVDKQTGFICALKVLNKSVIQKEDTYSTLLQQIKIQFYLNHPNIVKAYGCFSDNQNIYIMLEYCGDGTLQKLMKINDIFQQQEILPIITNVFEAVFYLHCEGILHRDIKPENIVITNGIYKLCDFGWAAYASGQNRSTFCGTPLYVSPQVLIGNGYNQKADIWGLGILCYELVYGQVPFKMNSPNDMVKIIRENIKFPEPDTNISDELLNLIRRMLNRDYEERISINELLSDALISSYITQQKEELSLRF